MIHYIIYMIDTYCSIYGWSHISCLGSHPQKTQASWLHTMEHDQGPFDETVLEMLSMEVSLTLAQSQQTIGI